MNKTRVNTTISTYMCQYHLYTVWMWVYFSLPVLFLIFTHSVHGLSFHHTHLTCPSSPVTHPVYVNLLTHTSYSPLHTVWPLLGFMTLPPPVVSFAALFWFLTLFFGILGFCLGIPCGLPVYDLSDQIQTETVGLNSEFCLIPACESQSSHSLCFWEHFVPQK